jgi:hypothetical protein
MKRIIDGVTYNTETATVVAEGSSEDENRGVASETTLYQTRTGVFFSVEQIESTWHDQNRGEWRTRKATEWEVVGDTAKAVEACEQLGLVIVRNFGDLPPEPEAGESAATVYMRAPPALKTALEARAKADGVSLNILMLRCAEECLKRQPEARSHVN